MSMAIKAGAAAMQGARRRAGPPAPPSLEAQILALYAAASWTVRGLFLARPDALTDVGGGEVSVWADLSGSGNHATQAVSGSRPTYSATAIGGGPGLTFANDWLVTPSISYGSDTAAVATAVYVDTQVAGTRDVLCVGWSASGNPGVAFDLKIESASDILRVDARSAGGLSQALTAGAYPLSTPAVISGTVDGALSASETEVRVDGTNATASRPTDSNNVGQSIRTDIVVIGANHAQTLGPSCCFAAVVIASGSTAIPLTQLAAVEALLADALAAGSYA